MTLHPAGQFSTRALSMLMLAAFAGVALWLFVPWDRAGSGWGAGGDAALPPSLRVDGDIQVETIDGSVTRLVIPVSLRGQQGIALTEGANVRAETLLGEGAAAAVPATASVTWLDGNNDRMLDSDEHALLTVNLPAGSSVHPANPLRLVVQPGTTAALVIENVLP